MLQQLLADLNSRNDAIHEEALRQARALPPEELFLLFKMASERRNQLKRQEAVIVGIGSALVAAVALLRFSPFPFFFPVMTWILLTSLLISLGHWLFSTYMGKRRGRVTERTLKTLLTLIYERNEIGFLLPLLQRMDFVHSSVIRSHLHLILKRLLPQLQPDHTATWTKAQKEALLLPLKYWKDDADLAICTLKALEQVGGVEAIPTVEDLARMHGVSFSYKVGYERVKKAAQDCLLSLTTRADEIQELQSLLRPAAGRPDDTPSQELLRPGQLKEP